MAQQRHRRHYATIGIDEVFLKPPPSHLLPNKYLEQSSTTENPLESEVYTWELVGQIKCTPEDFVVREISSRSIPRSPERQGESGTSLQVADLVTEAQSPDSDQTERPSPKPVSSDHVSCQHSGHGVDLAPANCEDKVDPREKIDRFLTPLGILTKILEVSSGDDAKDEQTENPGSDVLSSIQLLQREAEARIVSLSRTWQKESMPCTGHVWVPPLSRETSCLDKSEMEGFNGGGGDRGAFHRALKVACPLLCSKSVKRSEDDPDTLWIRVSVDQSLFGLIPYLFAPAVDLPNLYLFRNCGCKSKSRKWPFAREGRNVTKEDQGKASGDDKKNFGRSDCETTQVILRLRQDLPRQERRPVHQLIAKDRRDLETSTIPNYPLSSDKPSSTCDGDNTAAVVVKWSKKAQRLALQKRKRANGTQERENSNILCVMKKRQKEHLTAIQHLCSALRCRPHDIGLAGIKDMQAVTFQFCTIRNASIQCARQANSYLMHRNMELGTFRVVDWTLNNGDLTGNRFEIVLRNVSRVKVVYDDPETSDGVAELLVPCDASHFRFMVDRIRRHGFLNFYGEQRLGSPGSTSEVGVRSFDIGRAMLQQDFAEAVDLLVTGRLVCRGESLENAQAQRARQVWKDSGGDVVATLKSLPDTRSSGQSLSRERTVLQGLKRYGKSNPLEALKCLPFGVRTFWINAYQSYVWNTVATERIKRFGTNVACGDLYRDETHKKQVHIVEGDPSRVSLSQVVLPLPGFNVIYPTNEIGKVYQEILERDKVTFRRDAPPEATARGSYRNLVAFANNLEIEFCGKQDADGQEGRTLDSDIVTDVKFAFELKSGSYATSMLRELQCTTCERNI